YRLDLQREPGHGRGGLSSGGPVPAASPSGIGKRGGLAGPVSEPRAVAARVVDGHRTVRSPAGWSAGASLPGFRQPPSGEASVAGAALPVHLFLLARSGFHL